MAELTHNTITSNGINMHYVESGSGPLVVLCHGFPESWRLINGATAELMHLSRLMTTPSFIWLVTSLGLSRGLEKRRL